MTKERQKILPVPLLPKNSLEREENKRRLQIIPLGGLEEIGRNCTILRYGNDIIIVDMGLQFPEEDMPGIDYIIPNIEYLRNKSKMVRGVIITHGHYDHIGAIPHIMPQIGNPPIYTGRLTKGIILKRQEDFPHLPPLKIHTVTGGDKIKLGSFQVEFVHINHNIPDSFALAIKTPEGVVFHTGDFKFDRSPFLDKPADVERIKEIGKEGVLVLMSDSTDAEVDGYSESESEIKESLEEIFMESKENRMIVATFSSLISRIQQIFDLAQKYGRFVAIDGLSMKRNVEIARDLGYLKVNPQTLVDIRNAGNFRDSKILILCTGTQGEDKSVLMRIVQKDHPFVRIEPGDVVVFSSSVVPGNERTVQRVKDTLYRQGAKVFHYKMMDIHAGGHAHREDLKNMIKFIHPRYFIPVHGSFYMLKIHGDLAREVGIPQDNIFVLENGRVLNFQSGRAWLDKEKVPTNFVMVDGLGVGDVGEIVLRDRQKMSEDGMFVIIVTLDSKTGQPKEKIDIISRGFIYMNQSKALLEETRKKIREIVKETAAKEHAINWVYVKDNLRDRVGQFLYRKTHRRPLILPVVMEV